MIVVSGDHDRKLEVCKHAKDRRRLAIYVHSLLDLLDQPKPALGFSFEILRDPLQVPPVRSRGNHTSRPEFLITDCRPAALFQANTGTAATQVEAVRVSRSQETECIHGQPAAFRCIRDHFRTRLALAEWFCFCRCLRHRFRTVVGVRLISGLRNRSLVGHCRGEPLLFCLLDVVQSVGGSLEGLEKISRSGMSATYPSSFSL